MTVPSWCRRRDLAEVCLRTPMEMVIPLAGVVLSSCRWLAVGCSFRQRVIMHHHSPLY